jgi:hypothetical protein
VVTGRVTVHVDGTPVLRKSAWWLRHSWSFDVAGRAAVLTLVTYPTPEYSLTVDGAQLDSASAQSALRLATPMPKWAWAFAGACLLIPLIAVGGALPMLLGIGGAGLCSRIARSSKPQAQRIGLCALVTFAAWAVFVALVLLTARAQAGG